MRIRSLATQPLSVVGLTLALATACGQPSGLASGTPVDPEPSTSEASTTSVAPTTSAPPSTSEASTTSVAPTTSEDSPTSVAPTTSAPAESSLVEVTVSYDPTGPVDPVATAVLGGFTSAEIEQLIDEGVSDCMGRQGFVYEARSFRASEPLTRADAYAYRSEYGFGFNNAPSGGVTSANDPNLALMQKMSPDELTAYLDALEGPNRDENRPTEGCRVQAANNLVERVPALASDTASALSAARSALGAERVEIVDATKSYSECMRAAGYDLQRPSDAAGLASTLESFDDERRLALADLDCQSVTLWPAWDQVLNS